MFAVLNLINTFQIVLQMYEAYGNDERLFNLT
jgi:hypothetical protein